MKIKTILFITCILLVSVVSARAADEIRILDIRGSINPAVADYIEKGIEKASDDEAACVIIRMDTPGGLADAMRRIVKAIYRSSVPVAVYVGPAGARAASAGVMITLAADIAVMAPGTNIGAAHPVGAGGKEVEGTMSEKVTNDMVAYVKSIAEKRDRNIEWAEKAVRESVSITETEALNKNVIDLVANDVDELIRKINGRKVAGHGVLKLDNAKKVVVEETLRTRILKTISDPNIAYILMMIGLAGIYFELSHPGVLFPGIIGGICLILAFFSFQTLPVNYAGFLLILLAIVLFVMEMKIASFGLLTIGGIVCLVLGSVMLFESGSPAVKLSYKVIWPTVILISSFFGIVAALVYKSHTTKPRTGSLALVGEIGEVKKALMPRGKVYVHGELWNAESEEAIPEGENVVVVDVKNLVLTVRRVHTKS